MPDESIPEIPSVPLQIIEAVNNNELAVFIGAGVSRLIGCIGWDELAKDLVDCCYERSIINYKEKETLSQYSDHKKTITICFNLLDDNGLRSLFFEQMKDALKEDGSVKIPNIYDDIFGLRGLFITTNADTHFDRKFTPSNLVFRENDFDPEKIDRTKLYHTSDVK